MNGIRKGGTCMRTRHVLKKEQLQQQQLRIKNEANKKLK